MAYMTIDIKNFKIYFLIIQLIYLSVVGCNSQGNYLLGTWRCVKYLNYGEHKFDSTIAENIRNSNLIITSDKIFNENEISRTECDYFSLEVVPFDTTVTYGYYIEYLYPKKELSKIKKLIPTDMQGERTCFNDCSIFLLKQDTLIHICGGYTYYLLRKSK
jgi:hypothetical protein